MPWSNEFIWRSLNDVVDSWSKEFEAPGETLTVRKAQGHNCDINVPAIPGIRLLVSFWEKGASLKAP